MSGRFLRWALVGLVVTAIMGAALRLVFIGIDPIDLGLRFTHVRHAHSHLGYNLFLFPALWLAWRQDHRPVLSPAWTHVYGVVALLAAGAFAWRGYWWPSIAASTIMGVTWGWSMGRANRVRRTDWRAVAPHAVALALVMVVPIAVMTRRDPALAHHLVRSFLSLLLLTAMVPAVIGAASVPAWVWGVVSITASFGGGFEWAPGRVAGYAATGLTLLWAIRSGAVPLHVPRALWTMTGLGFISYAIGWPSAGHGASLAGVHVLALGPVAVGGLFVGQHRPVSALLWPYLASVVAMCTALLLGEVGGLLATRVAAWSGVATAVLLVGLVIHRLRPLPADSQAAEEPRTEHSRADFR